jgi:signal transduction histidine kinase
VFSLSREAFLRVLPDSPKLLATVISNLVAYARASSDCILREELEQRAMRAEMELERHRALTQMVAGVAHEINTPIGIVNTAASVIRQRLTSDELTNAISEPAARAICDDVSEAAGLIQSNIQRAHKLVHDFKQLAVSQFTDAREELSLLDVVREAVALFAINARQAKLDIHVRDAVTEGGGSRWVGYRRLMTQIVLNLLTNVERYAYPDGTGGEVDVCIRQASLGTESAFTVTFRDFGRGMPRDVLSRVFEPFYTTGRAEGATGLGLSIVHNLVTRALGGRIEVASEPGGGTAFTMTFPQTSPA